MHADADFDVSALLDSLVSPRPFTKAQVDETFRSAGPFLDVCGLTEEELGRLNVVHVTGTKGKGSACAMMEAILRECGYRTGLFTSPHLCDVRERIRLDGAKIDAETFAHSVKWIHRRCERVAKREGIAIPPYFSFLTLVALKVFCASSLDVVILEVGIGGRTSYTNVVPSPLICGVTSISLEHTDLLGERLSEIAFEKAGIFKKGARAFTVPQYQEAMDVLEKCARDEDVPLTNISHYATFRNWSEIQNSNVTVGVQMMNAILAVHMTAAFEEMSWRRPMRAHLRYNLESYSERMNCLRRNHELPPEYLRALSSFEWPGRLQIIRDVGQATPQEIQRLQSLPSDNKKQDQVNLSSGGSLTLYLDGAHTPESLHMSINWFAQRTMDVEDPIRFLLFHCQGTKDNQSLLKSILSGAESAGIDFRHVFFTPVPSYRFKPAEHFLHQRTLLATWANLLHRSQLNKPPLESVSKSPEFLDTSSVKQHFPPISADVFPSLLSALGWFRSFAHEQRSLDVRLLVTGSLYLVGDVLQLLGRAPK